MSKEVEGPLVRAQYLKAKSKERGLTQDALADELGCSQGLIAQWFYGRVRIPDETLLRLSVRLGFDPLSIRPELKVKYDYAAKVLANLSVGEYVFDDLTPDELAMVAQYVDLIRKSRDSK